MNQTLLIAAAVIAIAGILLILTGDQKKKKQKMNKERRESRDTAAEEPMDKTAEDFREDSGDSGPVTTVLSESELDMDLGLEEMLFPKELMPEEPMPEEPIPEAKEDNNKEQGSPEHGCGTIEAKTEFAGAEQVTLTGPESEEEGNCANVHIPLQAGAGPVEINLRLILDVEEKKK